MDTLAAIRQTFEDMANRADAEAKRSRVSARLAWCVAVAAMIGVAVGGWLYHVETREHDARLAAVETQKVGAERTVEDLRRDLAESEAEAADTVRAFASWLVGGEAVASRE